MNPLKFGWIDYSSEHREKVMAVLHALSAEGAVDELGIGQIRDRFADVLFPGTSTIQTRAKYFFIIPYILMELERETFASPSEFIHKLSDIEIGLIETLNRINPDGVIGARAGNKLKRKPSTIYWNGLRMYGFFKQQLTLQTYAKAVYSIKANTKLGSKFGDDLESNIHNIDGEYSNDFWRCLLPEKDWKENLTIDLSFNEADYLRERIIKSDQSKDSLFAHFLLNYDWDDLDKVEDFDAIEDMFVLPEPIKSDYIKAKKFNQFISGANIRYNLILSKGENKAAEKHWNKWMNSPFVKEDFASYPYMESINRLKVRNSRLILFLKKWQEAVLSGNESIMDELIINREIELKGKDRAKLFNTKYYSYKEGIWVGARNLQYRFSDAMTILEDIFAGLEEKHVTAS